MAPLCNDVKGGGNLSPAANLKAVVKRKERNYEKEEKDLIILLASVAEMHAGITFPGFALKTTNHLIAACISWGGKKLVAWCNIKITAEDFFNFIHSSYFLCVRILFLYFLNVSVCLFFCFNPDKNEIFLINRIEEIWKSNPAYDCGR